MIRVAIVDDQELVRAGFRVLLEGDDEIEVVGEASNGKEAVELASTEHPDVVLMDVRMPEMDGIEATRVICEADGGVRVVILTTFDLDEYVHEALRAGASGFLLKDTKPAALLEAVHVVADGEALLAPQVTRRLIAEFARSARRDRKSPEELAALTAREVEVLRLVAGGLSNQEIAETFFLSPATVKTHVSRILTKMHARDRAQLVVLAYETGLVQPQPDD